MSETWQPAERAACPRPANRSHGTATAYNRGCRCDGAIGARAVQRQRWSRTPAGQAWIRRKTARRSAARRYVDQLAVDAVLAGYRGIRLTRRERWAAIDQLTAAGQPASRIADLLGIATRTVHRHRAATQKEAVNV